MLFFTLKVLYAIAEVAQENLPAGFGYELGGMAREEAETSGSTTGLDLRTLLRIRLPVVECTVRKLHSSIIRIAIRAVRSVG